MCRQIRSALQYSANYVLSKNCCTKIQHYEFFQQWNNATANFCQDLRDSSLSRDAQLFEHTKSLDDLLALLYKADEDEDEDEDNCWSYFSGLYSAAEVRYEDAVADASLRQLAAGLNQKNEQMLDRLSKRGQ